MEAAIGYKPLQFLSKATDFTHRSSVLLARSSVAGNSLQTGVFVKRFCLISQIKQRGKITILTKGKMRTEIRASLNSSSGPLESSSGPLESSSELAPLQLESPVGQFLSQILLSHPHLLPAAVDQQLEKLLTELEAEKSQEEPRSSGTTELVLYRRIAEVKAKERRKALGEILYALVVQKFVDSDVSLVSSIPQSSNEPNEVGHWPSSEEKFQSLHSPEAFEMIKNHLSVILGNRLEDSNSIASISKLRVGQVYAASILYGYFLKRVDQRFQLDKSMKTLPWGSEEEDQSAKKASMEEASASSSSAQVRSSHPEELTASFSSGGFADRIKPCRLRSYVMSLDSETLQRFASVRSKEAFSITEKHTEALFGMPEIVITPQGAIDSSKEDLIKLSFSGLKRLILEAVTFGSFLWDVESYVDSRYHFVTS